MELEKLTDVLLKAYAETDLVSLSPERIARKKSIDTDSEALAEAVGILRGKSLVKEASKDMGGDVGYTITETGLHFFHSYGSYSAFVKGAEKEAKKVNRAKKKEPYRAVRAEDGVTPYDHTQKSFVERNWGVLIAFGAIMLALALLYNLND